MERDPRRGTRGQTGGVPPTPSAPPVFGRLLLLFLIVPILDLALLVSVGSRIGLGPTLAVVVVTAVAGSWLARREGGAAWRRVQAKMATGGVPGPELIDGLLILVSGTLLLTPGFLTDLVGLLGLLPPTRALARRALKARFEQAVQAGQARVIHTGFGGMTGGGMGMARPEPRIEDAEVIDDGTAS